MLTSAFKGPGSSRVLDALPCYLSLILKHSDTNLDVKHIVDQNLTGARACCAPLGIRHCIRFSPFKLCKLLKNIISITIGISFTMVKALHYICFSSVTEDKMYLKDLCNANAC